MSLPIKRAIELSSNEGEFEVSFINNKYTRPVLYFTKGSSHLDARLPRDRFILAGFDKPAELRALIDALVEVAEAYKAVKAKTFRVTLNIEAQSEDEALRAAGWGGTVVSVEQV